MFYFTAAYISSCPNSTVTKRAVFMFIHENHYKTEQTTTSIQPKKKKKKCYSWYKINTDHSTTEIRRCHTVLDYWYLSKVLRFEKSDHINVYKNAVACQG